MKRLLIVLLVVPLLLAAGCARKASSDYTGHTRPAVADDVEANYPWDLESM